MTVTDDRAKIIRAAYDTRCTECGTTVAKSEPCTFRESSGCQCMRCCTIDETDYPTVSVVVERGRVRVVEHRAGYWVSDRATKKKAAH